MPRARPYLIALVFSLSVAGVARAATVEIYADFGGAQLYVLNSLSIDLGAIDILVGGATGFTPNPANLGISLADTSYVSRPIPGYAWDSLVISNPRNGVSIADAGESTLLGSFQGVQPYQTPSLLPGEVEFPRGVLPPVRRGAARLTQAPDVHRVYMGN